MKTYIGRVSLQAKFCLLKRKLYNLKLKERQLICLAQILDLRVKSCDTKDDLIYKIVGEIGQRGIRRYKQKAELFNNSANNQSAEKETFSVNYIYTVKDRVFELLDSSRQLKRLEENLKYRELAYLMSDKEKAVFGLVEHILDQSGKSLNHSDAKKLGAVIQKVGQTLYLDELVDDCVFQKERKQKFVPTGNGRTNGHTPSQVQKFENKYSGQVFRKKVRDARSENSSPEYKVVNGKRISLAAAAALGL